MILVFGGVAFLIWGSGMPTVLSPSALLGRIISGEAQPWAKPISTSVVPSTVEFKTRTEDEVKSNSSSDTGFEDDEGSARDEIIVVRL